ncbi:MAG TPA: MFS transporter, partial [Thiohalobacter sp.]|nr:MFS transporter [Thiohalobacter sp.]
LAHTMKPVNRQVLVSLLRALHHRNYRLYFAGQGVSLVGTWITRVAASWLVWRLSQSPQMLGVFGFVSLLPALLLGPFAGVWVDRLNRHRLLVATQLLSMLQSLALAALALSGSIQVWHILALQLLQGVINAFAMPTRQSLLVELIEDQSDLPNAVALNSSMFNLARLIGPSIAGVLIVSVGEGWCFLIDGLSYLAVIASLLAMRLPPRPTAGRGRGMLHDLHDGLRHAFGFAPIRALLLLVGLIGLVGAPYRVLMPMIAARVLHGGAHTLGFLLGAMGIGALGGALYLASRSSVLGLGRLVPVASAAFGAGLIGLGLSRWLPLSLLIMVVTGFGLMVHMAVSNTLIQTLVQDHMRGRVMALYLMAFMGMATFGNLLAGVIAQRVGAAYTLMGGGLLCLLGATLFWRRLPELRRQVRPIYVEKGILPEVGAGLRGNNKLNEELEP